MIEPVVNAYREAILDTDRDAAFAVLNEALKVGVSAGDIVFKIVISAIETIFDSATQSFEFSLAQHFTTSQISCEVAEAMVPRFRQRPGSVGRLVIGTSHGDLDRLGKSVVAA
jgi:methanogenic corrinoid protein MtbC1